MNISEIAQLKNESLHLHTTFKTGGTADTIYLPRNADEICFLLGHLRQKGIPFCVIGRGSNLLVSDKGFPGAVVKIAEGFAGIQISGNHVYAEAGATLRDITSRCIQSGLAGLEFAGGIPGCLGGGVAMNAGAYGSELKDFISIVRLLAPDGSIADVSCSAMEFEYRTSIVQKNESIVLGAAFCLPYGDASASAALLADYNTRRRISQPLQFPSAGSTFKRPPGYFAGALIEQSGLKGFQIGGAQVSEKHAGFIINTGTATSRDIYQLICHVSDAVFRKTGIWLEPEVKLIGDFS